MFGHLLTKDQVKNLPDGSIVGIEFYNKALREDYKGKVQVHNDHLETTFIGITKPFQFSMTLEGNEVCTIDSNGIQLAVYNWEKV